MTPDLTITSITLHLLPSLGFQFSWVACIIQPVLTLPGHVYMKKSLPLRKEGETAATGRTFRIVSQADLVFAVCLDSLNGPQQLNCSIQYLYLIVSSF